MEKEKDDYKLVDNDSFIKIETLINSLFEKQNDKKKQAELQMEEFIKTHKDSDIFDKIIKTMQILIVDKNRPFRDKMLSEKEPINLVSFLYKLSNSYKASPEQSFGILQVFFEIKTECSPRNLADYVNCIISLLRGHHKIVLKNIEEIFKILFVLKLSSDEEVRLSCDKFCGLIREIIKNYYDANNSALRENIKFDEENFLKIFLEKIVSSSTLKEFLISWIEFIVRTPELKAIKSYSKILPFLFTELSSSLEPKVKEGAEKCINILKNEFAEHLSNYFIEYSVPFEEVMMLIIEQCILDADQNKKIYLSFLEKILNSFYEECKKVSSELKQIMFRSKLLPEFLRVCLNQKRKDDKLNSGLKKIFQIIPDNYEGLNMNDFEKVIKSIIVSKEDINFENLLPWCELLYHKFGKKLFSNIPEIINLFAEVFPENNDTILFKLIDFLCKIAHNEEYIEIIVNKISEKFFELPNPKEDLPSKILGIITEKLNASFVFTKLSEKLLNCDNVHLIYVMVIRLNGFLISVDSSNEVRTIIKDYKKKGESQILFEKMFRVWSYNPMGALLLCLLADYFELSFHLILNFYDLKFEDESFSQLNQIVNLFESSPFDNVRIRLAEPTKNIYLVKTLLGILMLLPQGYAYNALSNRIRGIETLLAMEDELIIQEEDPSIMKDVNHYIEIFLEVQNTIKNKQQ